MWPWRRLTIDDWPIGTKLFLLIIPLLIVVTMVAAWAVHARNMSKNQGKLTQRAKSLHTQIMADREYYASVIVPRVIELGGTLGADYRHVRGRFPLPATFVREVSERTENMREGYYVANLISPWPINKEKGIKDQFQEQGFEALMADPTAHFLRTDTIDGKAVMRALMADVAKAQSCVDCHNTHPQSPKHDFQLHDLMGGLEIVIPMDEYMEDDRTDLALAVGGGAGLCLLLVGVVVIGTRQIIRQPLAGLAGQMHAFAASLGDASALPLSKSMGDEVKFLAAAHDHMRSVVVSQQRQLENMNTRLQEQVVQLKATNYELEAFSYSVSHDLRAPLRAIAGFSRILLEDHGPQVTEEIKHSLQRVCANAEHMDHLVTALLALSRLGRQAIALQPVEPQRLISEIVDGLRLELEKRRVEIRVGNLPGCQADPTLLKEVFTNLISNAIKFTRHREVGEITIGCSSKGDTNVYFVRDNGVGFDMQFASKLFGAFQRLHRVEDYEGTGVGLATVKRIILRHGGRVWAESEVDKGATIYFTLAGGEGHERESG